MEWATCLLDRAAELLTGGTRTIIRLVSAQAEPQFPLKFPDGDWRSTQMRKTRSKRRRSRRRGARSRRCPEDLPGPDPGRCPEVITGRLLHGSIYYLRQQGAGRKSTPWRRAALAETRRQSILGITDTVTGVQHVCSVRADCFYEPCRFRSLVVIRWCQVQSCTRSVQITSWCRGDSTSCPGGTV